VTSDASIGNRMEELVQEEHRLWDAEGRNEATEDDRRRLRKVKFELDRCWDLLRQRRGLEEFGLDPDTARVRAESVVEKYEQ
jgi:hypothetical protein